MLDRFMDIFRKKKEVAEIDAVDILAWVEKKTEDAKKDLSKPSEIFTRELEKQKKIIYDTAKKLSDATLANEKISVREKQFMEGNRKSFISRTIMFADNLTAPEPGKISNIPHEIAEFHASTNKSASILNNYFLDHIRDISAAIKSIEKADERYSEHLSNTGIESLYKSVSLLQKIEDIRKKKRDLSKEMEMISQEVSDIEKQVALLEKQKKDLKLSDEYKDYCKTKDSLESLRKENKKTRKLISSLLLPLKPVIKKYHHITLKKDISDMLLKESEDISRIKITEIKDFFSEMENALESEGVDLSPKKKTKAISALRSFDADKLLNLFLDISANITKQKRYKDKLKRENIGDNIGEIDYRLVFLLEKKAGLKKTLDALGRRYHDISTDILYSNIEKMLEKDFPVKIIRIPEQNTV